MALHLSLAVNRVRAVWLRQGCHNAAIGSREASIETDWQDGRFCLVDWQRLPPPCGRSSQVRRVQLVSGRRVCGDRTRK